MGRQLRSAGRWINFRIMRAGTLLAGIGFLLLSINARQARADEVEMQNGDRYVGRVIAVSSDTLVFSNEVLGRINVPRQKVASLAFGTNSIASHAPIKPVQSVSTNHPTVAVSSLLTNSSVDLSAALRRLGANTNFVTQVRQQMLAGSPEAGSKYDQMVSGLMNGNLNLGDIRREAQSSAKQLEDLKRELGPEADDLLDGYLLILNGFLKETGGDSETSP